MDTLLLIHSFVRWIIILVAVIVIVSLRHGLAAKLFKAMEIAVIFCSAVSMELASSFGLDYLTANGIAVTVVFRRIASSMGLR